MPPETSPGIAVLEAGKGTQEEPERGGFVLDPEEESATSDYLGARHESRGAEAIERLLDVSLEVGDGNLVSATTITDLGGPPFAQRPTIRNRELVPEENYESCTLSLVLEGSGPRRVSYLPDGPERETEFVCWDVE